MSVSAVIVTRGDVLLDEPLATIHEAGIDEVIVWDNTGAVRRSTRDGLGLVSIRSTPFSNERLPDLGVYGRYAAIEYASGDLIYVQDDDCVIEPEAVAALIATAEWRPGGIANMIVANMPMSRWDDYPDSCLVGWGAVFQRDLPGVAFARIVRWLIGSRSIQPADPGLWLTTMLPPRGDFVRTCDVLFTTLTPHRKIDLGFRHLPWAETAGRMFKQPNHKKERDEMLELARRVRDGN